MFYGLFSKIKTLGYKWNGKKGNFCRIEISHLSNVVLYMEFPKYLSEKENQKRKGIKEDTV